jgi:hypothetical protein
MVGRPASAEEPLLRLHDIGHRDAGDRAPLREWHTQLSVLTRLTRASLPVLAAAQLALIQRLDAAQAALAASALLLPPDCVEVFSAMDYEMIGAFRGSAVRYVWLTPTAIERQQFG